MCFKILDMKKIIFVMLLILGCGSIFSKDPVELRINTAKGFLSPNEKDFIVVEIPGKSVHQIYVDMAVNIGLLYVKPNEVMYGVEDKYISVRAHSNNFCNTDTITWEAYYKLEFLIKDEKVLVFMPSVESVEQKNVPFLQKQKMSFPELITKYWYDKSIGKFIPSENNNMIACEDDMVRTINMILGFRQIKNIPEGWL